jgi:hypothetical protein
MDNKPRPLVRACLLMLLALALAGCWEATLDLPGGWKQASWRGYGYFLFKTAENTTRIELEIGPTVKRCQVIGTVITGHVVAEPPKIGPYRRPTSGYFVVDTATGRVWQGLDEATWQGRLRDVGITDEPALKRLSRFNWKCTAR